MKRSHILMLLVAQSLVSFANTVFTNGVEWTYAVLDGGVKIGDASTNYRSGAIPTSTSGELVIPNELGGLPVFSLGDYAFRNCTNITSVIIPEGITMIGGGAFEGCVSLTNVVIGDDVENIEYSAFERCVNLTSVTFPPRLKHVGTRAFLGCSSLLDVTFNDSIKIIEALAFINTPYDTKVQLQMNRFYHNGFAGSCEKSINLTVTNVVVVHVLNSVQPDIAMPESNETGFVSIVAEVKGNTLAVPSEWATNFTAFVEMFGSDFTKALTKTTGKRDGAGNEMCVWQDYVAGTDPTDPDDVFKASITYVDGEPLISWTPELPAEQAALRKYTIYGKVRLSDEVWAVVDGDASNYNFYKVTVEMK